MSGAGDAVGEEIRVDTALGPIAGLRWGRRGAPSVLALHGWLDNAASFTPLAGHLDDIELVAVDLPGHGRSVHLPRGADYSLDGAIASVLDIADALGWARFALLGHSMGAAIASLVAAGAPARVRRLLAIEALGALPETIENTLPRLRTAVAAARALADKPMRVFPELALAIHARMRANGGLSEAAARLLVERGTRAVAGGHVWSSDQRLTLPTRVRMSADQVDALLGGIECPTRVIYATPAQPYLPESVRSRRAAMLPAGEVVRIAGGHHLHMEQPRAVAAAIGDFFRCRECDPLAAGAPARAAPQGRGRGVAGTAAESPPPAG